MEPGHPDEALLSALATAGPEERRRIADELFSRYYVQVARWCYRCMPSQEEAADLAQDVFVKAYRNLDSFRGDAQFSTWLYTIVRNEALSRHRRSAPPRVDNDRDALESVPAVGDGPDSALERKNRREHINRLLTETLDAEERRVFVLHYGDDMTLEQITRMLGLTNASGAKAYLVSARRKLTRAVQRLRARRSVL